MSITLSPSKIRYLEGVRAELSDLSAEEREEVVVDLEAHLSELDDDRVEAELGAPAVFADEFRRSAGLDHRSSGGVGAWSAGAQRLSRYLTESAGWSTAVTRWGAFRPTWIWIRGWLVVAIVAGSVESHPFQNFPIPDLGGQTLVGLMAVAGATWLSHWLDSSTRGWRSMGSALFSAVAGLALFLAVTMPLTLTRPSAFVEVDPAASIYQLTAPGGSPVENIYAFDLDGSPLEVLLFDQDGRPLRSLPVHVYEEAELHPADTELPTDSGAVRFRRDSFGRIIPNLYPLELLHYDQNGQLTERTPPSLGFPGSTEAPMSTTTSLPRTDTTFSPG